MYIGRVGGSLHDFESLTIKELSEVFESHRQAEEAAEMRSWEQSRMIAYMAVSPYAKSNFRPTDIMVFEWERETLRKKKEQNEAVVIRHVMKVMNLDEPPKFKKI